MNPKVTCPTKDQSLETSKLSICEHQNTPSIGVPERFAIAILFFGAFLRIVQFAFNRSMWLDEASLAENISELGILEMFGPLMNSQAAPVGFLLLEKFISSPFGFVDWSLRIVPLLAGLGTLYFFFLLARETLDPVFMLMACTLLSLADFTIYYSSEIKPYSCDTFFAILITFLAYRVLSRFSRRYFWFLVGFGTLSIWISFPSVFVLGGIWIILLFQCHFRKHEIRKWAAGSLLISVSWGISALSYYFLFLRYQNSTAALQDFWSFAFMPMPPASAIDIGWFYERAIDFFVNPLTITLPELAILVTIFGIGSLFMRNRLLLALCGLPAVFALLASGMHYYPFARRLILFLIPLAIIVLASGLGLVARWSRVLAWLVFATVIILPVRESVFHLFVPRTHEHIKPLIKDIKTMWEPGDVLVVDSVALPAFRLYGHEGFQVDEYLVKDYKQLNELPHNSRVWYLTSHRYLREIAVMRRSLADTRTIVIERIADHTYKKMDGEAALFLLSPSLPNTPIRFRPGIGDWHGVTARDRWSAPFVALRNINLQLQQRDRFLIIVLNGTHPFRRNVDQLGLRSFFNGSELDFVSHTGNRYVFAISDSNYRKTSMLRSIRLEATPFVPSELGLGNDSRALGLDLEALEIGPIGHFFYPPEIIDARALGDPDIEGEITFMWSRKKSSLLLTPKQKGVFFIKAGHPDIETTPVSVEVLDDGSSIGVYQLKTQKWGKVEFQLEGKNTTRVMTFVVDRTWNPKEQGLSEDSRDLGIAVAFVPIDELVNFIADPD